MNYTTNKLCVKYGETDKWVVVADNNTLQPDGLGGENIWFWFIKHILCADFYCQKF